MYFFIFCIPNRLRLLFLETQQKILMNIAKKYLQSFLFVE